MDWQAKLDAMLELEPGWNGYDAPTPTHEAVETASYMIMATYQGKEFLNRVSPSVNGGVGITFKNPDAKEYRKVYLEIDQGGETAAMFVADGKINTIHVQDDFEGREKFYSQMTTFLASEKPREEEMWASGSAGTF
jgi:hypothetical protein